MICTTFRQPFFGISSLSDQAIRWVTSIANRSAAHYIMVREAQITNLGVVYG